MSLIYLVSQAVLCVFSVFTAPNNKCEAAACECDRAAALCFTTTKNKYNPKQFLDQRCCKK